MSYAVVFRRVEDPVRDNRLLVGVRKYLKSCTRCLGHRPRIRLRIDADRNQFATGSFDVVVILSQPGELLCAGASPEATIEDQYNRGFLSKLRKNYQFAVAVWQCKIWSFIAKLQRRRFSGFTFRNSRRRERRLTRLRTRRNNQQQQSEGSQKRLHNWLESNLWYALLSTPCSANQSCEQ